MKWESGQSAGHHPGDGAHERLGALSDELLRRALRAADDGTPDESCVLEALRELCHRARANDLRAEELLIVIKKRWRRLPEATRVPGDGTEALLARVIASCIREFYSPEGPPTGRA